jgi:hypothetical protein
LLLVAGLKVVPEAEAVHVIATKAMGLATQDQRSTVVTSKGYYWARQDRAGRPAPVEADMAEFAVHLIDQR